MMIPILLSAVAVVVGIVGVGGGVVRGDAVDVDVDVDVDMDMDGIIVMGRMLGGRGLALCLRGFLLLRGMRFDF